MSSLWAFAAYGLAFLAAMLLLYYFHAPWYWHALSVAASVALGVTRFPPEWHSPEFDLMVGAAFVFLFFWGVGALFLHGAHHGHHHKERHA